MIKDKLMEALKVAAADYNGGTGADSAVAKAAAAADFNEQQTYRLVEMFNTALALGQEKSASDPAGACDLADKAKVTKMLLDGVPTKEKKAEVCANYGFYGNAPERTTPSIEARRSGMMCKSASGSPVDRVPEELDVSKDSLFRIIQDKIALLKSASEAAGDVASCLRNDASAISSDIARAIETSPHASDMADLFKSACHFDKAVAEVSEYSTLLAGSDGGRYLSMQVFDSSRVDGLIEKAAEVERMLSAIPEYERKREYYMTKASEAIDDMKTAVGLSQRKTASSTLADMLTPNMPVPAHETGNADTGIEDVIKMANAIRTSDACHEEISRLITAIEKDAGVGLAANLNVIPTAREAYEATMFQPGVDSEKKRLMNIRRALLLADLMTNDPIIRDGDPDAIVEAYKTMIMVSPRVSLDKAQTRAFLRSAINSVAISPNDAKTIADVDKGMSLSNVDIGRLSGLDSSIKDSYK